MSIRPVASATLLAIASAAVAVTVVSSVSLAAQDAETRAAASKAAASKAPAAPAKPFKAPRTPWGDPDLQGTYSNAFENGTPLERPQQFEGRRVEDVKGDELLEIKKAAHERALISFGGGLHAPDFFWQTYYEVEKGAQAWLVVDPPDGKIPTVTPEGRQRAAARAAARRNSGRGNADSYEDRSLYDRCVTRGLPGSMMPAIYGSHYDITQGPGYVAIRYEMVHETRVIPLNAGPHVGSKIRSYMGDARGHWEGETLVVETTNFRIPYQGSSEDLRLIEKFTRYAPKKVAWSVTVEDPKTWVRPWTFSMPLTMDADAPVLEYGCHEGNYGLVNILKGGRADDRKYEELRKKGFNIRPPEISTAAEGEEER